MNFELLPAKEKDISKLIEYKLNNIFEYAKNLDETEIIRITNYVKKHIPFQLRNYKVIVIDKKIVGCVLVIPQENGLLLDEIYIEKSFRNNGIGTCIITNILKESKTTYLCVYKENNNAIKLYKKIGFTISSDEGLRYNMKHE